MQQQSKHLCKMVDILIEFIDIHCVANGNNDV